MSRKPASIWFAPPGAPDPPSPRRARPDTPLRALRKLIAPDPEIYDDAPSTPTVTARAKDHNMSAISLTSSLTSSGESGSSPRQSGSSPRQSGSSPRQSGGSPLPSGSGPRQSGGSPRQSGGSPRKALPRTRVFCARAERGDEVTGRVKDAAGVFGEEAVWEGVVDVPDFGGNGRAEAVFWGAGGFLEDEECDYVSEGDDEICLAPVPKQGMDGFGERARVEIGERAPVNGERARGTRVDRLAKSCERGIARRAISAMRTSPSFGNSSYGGGAGSGAAVVRDGEVLREGVVKGINAKDFEDITRVATDGFGYGFGMREQRRGVLSRIGRRIGRLH